MGKFETNQIDIKGDGRIILYQRPDVKNPKWQCRISVPGSTGYKIFSTKELDKLSAERIALDRYEELYFKVRSGGSLKGKPFRTVYLEWCDYLTIQNVDKSPEYTRQLKRKIETTGLEFFKNKPIDEITESDLHELITWSSVISGKQLSSPTIRQTRTGLNNLFSFAKSRGYISSIPEISAPSLKRNPRPDFSSTDWKKLYTYMRKWVKDPTKGNRGLNGLDHKRYRERYYLQQYILVLSNTGIRVGEIRNVTWNDLDKVEITKGDERLIISVDGKTGKRDVIANPGVENYVKRLWDFRTKELGHEPDRDEFIFCHPNGKKIGSYRKGFNNLLEMSGLRKNKDGQNRTVYSLRHTYATMRLNDVPVYQLSVNMGTSVEMIELYYGHARTRDKKFVETVTKGKRKGTGKALPF